MIDVKALQGQVKNLVDDLREQVSADPALDARLRQEHASPKIARRVGFPYETWLEGELDKAAVAWVLGCVFVRFCEDNSLIDRVWIGGPEPEASTERAMQARQAYVRANPTHYEREWLRAAFEHLKGLRATHEIFEEHNPVWQFSISGAAAEELADFFRRGAGFRSLKTAELDTHFLGDLYQDLSAYARTTYALLQTPEFVEEFILDRTLNPALEEFGLAELSVIDPTCGSGHFLIGAFHRLLGWWRTAEPATDIGDLVERALGQVTGVDLNYVAVAIARFRLIIAALRATERRNLNNFYPVRVANGDSLLRWGVDSSHQGDLFARSEGRPDFAYYTEDGDLLAEYLQMETYTVVVGNPPYITVKDPKLNELYRSIYPRVCYRQYALTVPFAQRFFELARRGDAYGYGAGYIGQITSNSFMKREFGKNLINDYFANEVELSEVIDTSGAFIPGHGTPTVILVGKNRLLSDRYSRDILVIMGIRGEPSQPDDPAKGWVWNAILNQIDEPGSESEWLSVAKLSRKQAVHPWSIEGGGAGEIVQFLEFEADRLKSKVSSIGRTTATGADDVFFLPNVQTAFRMGNIQQVRELVVGEGVRDFQFNKVVQVRNPYRDKENRVAVDEDSDLVQRSLWQHRTLLANRVIFGKTIVQNEKHWYCHLENYSRKLQNPLGIAFSFVATHNHFVLDRDGRLFNRTSPVIKMPKKADIDDHLNLLGVLNSSTACFWLKQISQSKGNGGIGGGIGDESWEPRYEFTGTKLEHFPLPQAYPLELARQLDSLAQKIVSSTPSAVANSGIPARDRLDISKADFEDIRGQMIALQEELDWEVYKLYGLMHEELRSFSPPKLKHGERAFEIALARMIKAGKVETQWFKRHGSTAVATLPSSWPADYRALVERRIEIIESDPSIRLIEQPSYKRRWLSPSWDSMQTAALRDWLLDRLEHTTIWCDSPSPLSVAQLADRIRHDEDFRSVLALWIGTDQHDLVPTLRKLIADEHVPYLPTQRYKPSGLRKRAQWERTWALQRLEDAGESVTIDVPPKYSSADFLKPSYWRNRGKLDVPKERFISYPRMGRDEDDTELLGWAGWDHLDQARALVSVYLDRKKRAGWPADRLLPLLAGLAELEPWLHQWYPEPQRGFPSSPAEFFTNLIDRELSILGADRRTLAKLRGVEELS